MRRQKWASSALLARELAPFDVTVNAVVPGAIRTRAHNRLAPEVIDRIKAGAPAGFIAEPEDVAGCVAFLASDDARYVTGANPAHRRRPVDGLNGSRIYD
jgi:NAD(P)-dependent dehydrogenase (short-subunit alcohol dehydrogenase family)